MKSHFLYYFLGNSFIQGINFLVLPIIGRNFSPAEYAVVPLLEVYLMIFSWSTSMMILSGFDRYYFDERFNRVELLDTVYTFLLSTGLSSFLLGLLVLSLSGKLLEHRHLILAATLQQVLLQLYQFPLEKWKLDKKPGAFMGFSMAKSVLYLAVFGISVMVFKQDIAAIYEAQAISLSLVLGLFACYDKELRALRLKVNPAILKTLLSFSAPLILAGIGMYTIESSSRFFIKVYAGDAALGNFSFVYKIVNALSALLMMPCTSVWTPYVFSNLSNEALIRRSMSKVVVLLTAAALGIVIALLANYYYIIDFMSRGKFQIPIEVFGVLSTGYVFYCLLSVLAPGFHIREKTGLLVRYFLIGGGVNIILNALLIPRWQLMGAALAVFLSFLLILLLYAVNLECIFKIEYAWGPLTIIWLSFLLLSSMIIRDGDHVYNNGYVLLFLGVAGVSQRKEWIVRQGKRILAQWQL